MAAAQVQSFFARRIRSCRVREEEVNRNTIIAFALILGCIFLFTSPNYYRFYYTKILKKPYPFDQKLVTPPPRGALTPRDTGAITTPPPDTVKQAIPEKAPPKIAVAPKATDTIAVEPEKQKAVHQDTVWVETNDMICGMQSRGARIFSIKNKHYRYYRTVSMPPQTPFDTGYIEMIPQGKVGGPDVSIDKETHDSCNFSVASGQRNYRIAKGEKQRIVFECADARGIPIQKEFVFSGDEYRIGCNLRSNAISGRNIDFGWKCGIAESEYIGPQSTGYDQRTVHYSDGKSVDHIQDKKETREITGNSRWIGVTSKYFLIALVNDTVRDAEMTISPMYPRADSSAAGGGKKVQNPNYSISSRSYVDKSEVSYWIYAGPSQLTTLAGYHVGLEKALFGSVQGSGGYWFSYFFLRADKWFPVLCTWVLWLLNWLYAGVRDYGIVIILLTIISKVITFPLTQSSMKSMGKMKDLQPKINHIRERYKRDPRKMNEEIMALYKAEGVNPFNPGCLPLVLQMPVFFALFIVLRKAIELRGAHTVLVPWINDLSQAEALPVITPLFQQFFPGGLPMYGYSVGLLPIIMAILTFFQNKMTIKDPNQKFMIWFMPVFLLVLFNSFSSGLVLYWTFQNALGIIQQYYTNKSLEHKPAESNAGKLKKMPAKR